MLVKRFRYLLGFMIRLYDFCIRADLLHTVKQWEGHSTYKVRLVNFEFRALTRRPTLFTNRALLIANPPL